ncbi:MAG: hypothetical protein M1832_002780 [Thelocarpon impressellum]|nr:MAG: hypothetical protein M1832_002780 [Thelocarpon impressellum]
MGFFGKGSLSRSEPNWLDKEKRKRGLLAQETSEEVTRRRRQERQEFKNERARKEREAIDERLKEEGKLSKIKDVAADAASNGSTNPEDVGLIRPFVGDGRASKLTLASEAETVAPETALSDTQPKEPVSLQTSSKKRSGFGRNTNVPSQGQSSVPLLDLEHLQLTMEEAFFLVYGVGVLEITAEGGSLTISVLELLSLFRQHSYFPPSPTPPVAPDDPFLISYVVYHHFRSLGWVVRPGIKFAVDYLLYNRGPVFAHAEFAVMIIPSYASAAEPDPSSRRVDFPRKDRRDWWWLHCVNRVQAQVHKTLVLVYVEVPLLEPEDLAEAQGVTGITRLLQRYKVREMMLKRWTPNRSRD